MVNDRVEAFHRPPGAAPAAGRERWARRLGRALRASAGTLFACAALAATVWAAYRFLTTSVLFTVSRVSVEGGERTPFGDFVSVVEAARGKNLFTLDIEALRAEAEKHPWVREAVVYRVAPHGVRVLLREPIPTAIVECDGAMHWLDERGSLIEPVSEWDWARGVFVPLLVGGGSGDAMVAGAAALDTLRNAAPDFYERVASLDASHADRFVVRLKDYDGPLYLHRTNVLRNFDNLAAVWGNLAARHPSPRYVDLRWKNQIVVMPLSGQAKSGGRAESASRDISTEPFF